MNRLWLFQLSLFCNKHPRLYGIKQPQFSFAHKFCGSRIWAQWGWVFSASLCLGLSSWLLRVHVWCAAGAEVADEWAKDLHMASICIGFLTTWRAGDSQEGFSGKWALQEDQVEATWPFLALPPYFIGQGSHNLPGVNRKGPRRYPCQKECQRILEPVWQSPHYPNQHYCSQA